MGMLCLSRWREAGRSRYSDAYERYSDMECEKLCHFSPCFLESLFTAMLRAAGWAHDCVTWLVERPNNRAE